MSDTPPDNTVVRWVREYARSLERLASLGDPADLELSLPPGFVYEDRRSGMNFGALTADEFRDLIASTWEVGSDQRRWSIGGVIATRGERLALVEFQIDYGDGSVFESIQLLQIDQTLSSWLRIVDFDVHDLEAAIAELERLHVEIETDDS
jgi:hypothetical protein